MVLSHQLKQRTLKSKQTLLYFHVHNACTPVLTWRDVNRQTDRLPLIVSWICCSELSRSTFFSTHSVIQDVILSVENLTFQAVMKNSESAGQLNLDGLLPAGMISCFITNKIE